MHFSTLATGTLLLGLAFSASIPSSFVLHEKRNSAPSAWVKRSRAPHDIAVPVRVGITQRNIHLGHDYLMDVSDPRSANYGKHWTPKQIAETFAPTKETIEAVREWLAQSGVHADRHTVSPSRGHIQFHANVSEVEELLGTEYHLWEHVETGDTALSCEQYHVPHHIKHHIDFVSPTIGFNAPQRSSLKKRSSSIAAFPSIRRPAPPQVPAMALNGNLSNCDQAITPDCVKGEKAAVSEDLNTHIFSKLYMAFQRMTALSPETPWAYLSQAITTIRRIWIFSSPTTIQPFPMVRTRLYSQSTAVKLPST